MSLQPADLLRRLASGVRPGADAPASSGAAPIESTGFSELLRAARAGELRSERPLSLAKGAEGKLSENQLERLAVAADAAEASGSRRLLAVIDGNAVTIDIDSRTVHSVTADYTSKVLSDVDSVVFLPSDPAASLKSLFGGDAERANQSSHPGAPRLPIRNTSVASFLASLEEPREPAAEQFRAAS